MIQDIKTNNFEFIRQTCGVLSSTVTPQENRIKELEELLDLERDSRKKLEKNNRELEEQLETATNQVKQCFVSASQYNDTIRRRDADIKRLRKELGKLSTNMEVSEQNLKRKNHSSIFHMKFEMENLNNLSLKNEKEKMILLKELESTLVQLDLCTKAKSNMESRTENAEIQLSRTKHIVEELEQYVKDLSTAKVMLGEENVFLKDSIHKVTQQNDTFRKANLGLEIHSNETKKLLEGETRVREELQKQNRQIHEENDHLKQKLENESENHYRLQLQFTRVNGELSLLKTKYDKDISEKIFEFDEIKRKSAARIIELTEEGTQKHIKANALEKTRQQLVTEISNLGSHINKFNTEVETLRRNGKLIESSNNELQSKLQEQDIETTTLRITNGRISLENSRLKKNLAEEEDKTNLLRRENAAFSAQVLEALENFQLVSKELSEVQALKNQIESEKIDLISELEETKEMFLESERKFQASHNNLLQLKTEMEQRLVEKNEELESLRKSTQRTTEDLSANLKEQETRYKIEITKLKKKYDIQNKELVENFETVKRENFDLSEELKKVAIKLKEVENSFEGEKQNFRLAQEKLLSSEKRKTQLQGDLVDSNRLLETAEKARKKFQIDMEMISKKLSDYSFQINSLTNDKRKLENEIATLKFDIEDLSLTKMENDERVTRCCNELSLLKDEIKQEREDHNKSKTLNITLCQQLKETKTRLEQNESVTTKEIAKNVQEFQEKFSHVERELKAECARSKDAQIIVRKQERVTKELQMQAEADRNSILEYKNLLEQAQTKVKNYKRQVDELEAVNSENVIKYQRLKIQKVEVEQKVYSVERKTNSTVTTANYSNF